jgi:NAD(P)-dependent dehydrogenase (short-subunit alcohol dehydrogenase family)
MSRYAAVHANPQGPGDARPTALQIIKDENLLGKLSDKVILITGGNSGVGLETAKALHATGATIYITARTSEKLEKAINDIKSWPEAESEAPVYGIELRLDSFSSVRAAAKTFLEKSDKLNVLVLNAGVMATPEGRTEDGFETQFGTNHLGHFLLFHQLKPALLTASTRFFQSRVISLTSKAHRMGDVRFDDFNSENESYNPWVAYAQSKTANIYFATELERRYGSRGVHGLAVHPGSILTNLTRYIDLNQFDLEGELGRYLKSPEQGAATTVYAALSKDWEGRGGKYLGNCAEEPPLKPGVDPTSVAPGYAAWIYNQEAEGKLWEESLDLVGVKEQDKAF